MPDVNDRDEMQDVVGEVLDTLEGAPAAAVDVAIGLLALSRVTGEVMALLEDSSGAELSHRGDAGPRALEFALGSYRLDVEVDPAEAHLTGEVVPADVSHIEIVTATGATSTAPDDAGRFRLALTSHAPFRLRLQVPDGRTLTTPIVVI